jgi:hypothetical protein
MSPVAERGAPTADCFATLGRMRSLWLALLAMLAALALLWALRVGFDASAPATPRSEPRADAGSTPSLSTPIVESEPQRQAIEPTRDEHQSESLLARAEPSGARLLARLIEVDGRPKAHSSYLLTPLDANRCPSARERWIERVSDAHGVVDERELEPGSWRVMFAPTYCSPQSVRVELRAGLNDLGTLTFPPVVEAGSVCVRTLEREPLLHGVLWLRSVDSLAVDRWNFLVGAGRTRLEPGTPFSFCFEHLPAGEYEVRLFAHDALGVRVDTQRVNVPGSEVVFERVAGPRIELFVDVRVSTQAPEPQRSAVLSFHRRTRTFQTHNAPAGLPIAHIETDDERRWFAVAAGGRPREFQVDPRAARDGRLELAVDLEAGFGALIATRAADALLRTPGIGHESQLRRERAEMLAGVQLHSTGVPLLYTDGDGLGLLSAAVAPNPLEAASLTRCPIDVVNFRDGALLDPLAPITFWLAWVE